MSNLAGITRGHRPADSPQNLLDTEEIIAYSRSVVTIAGREFSAEILIRIRDELRGEPELSRRQLSMRVCEWMGWRNANGRLQEMSCRKSLLQLHRRGVIQLPPVSRRYAFQEASTESVCPPVAMVECSLAELGEVEIVPVTTSALSAVWRGMLNAHHYLRSGPLCGAQLRYLIRSSHYGWLGGLSYSASALRVDSRDEWIGWSDVARRRNLALVVNNSRFLIVPSVKVKCLASWVLARTQARLRQDWERVYGYAPVLMETYVERGRFAGTCYRAGNWTRVGSTVGRGPAAADSAAGLDRSGTGRSRYGRCAIDRKIAANDWDVLRQAHGQHSASVWLADGRKGSVSVSG